jgi:hypothetical protein
MVYQGRPTIIESSWEARENYGTLIRICASLPRYKISTSYIQYLSFILFIPGIVVNEIQYSSS